MNPCGRRSACHSQNGNQSRTIQMRDIMTTAAALPKSAGSIQVLQLRDTGKNESQSEYINSALKKFPETCDACGKPLRHEDLIGTYGHSVFNIKGYSCPACGHKVGKVFYKNCRDSVVPFEWTRLHIPWCGKSESTRGEY